MFAHGIMFHHFHGSTHPSVQGSISADELASILDHYGPKRILSADEWLDRTTRNALRPEHVCLTFDDSLKCQYDIASPVLKERGIRAFWFLYSSPFAGELNRLELYRVYRTTYFDTVEAFYEAFYLYARSTRFAEQIDKRLLGFDPQMYLRQYPFYTNGDRKFRFVRDEILGPDAYQTVMDGMISSGKLDLVDLANGIWLDVSDIRNLRHEGHIIGLHSHSHPTMLARLNYESQYWEYRTNVECLEDIVGEKATTMSHPSNSYNRDTLEILDRLGVILGFRSDIVAPAKSNLEFPRQDHANIVRKVGT